VVLTAFDNKFVLFRVRREFTLPVTTTDNYHAVSLIFSMGLFGSSSKKKPKQKNDKTDKSVSYDDALRTGSSIGKLITNIWNSQKNPGKAYVLNRRVHHGEIGILLGLSNLIKKSRPATAGVFSGLGEALAQDDIADKEDWFSFKKKEDKTNLETSTSEQKRNGNEKE
jgi:hypothetical protein